MRPGTLREGWQSAFALRHVAIYCRHGDFPLGLDHALYNLVKFRREELREEQQGQLGKRRSHQPGQFRRALQGLGH